VLNYFLRLEFQDGSRKAPTQTYHGSGRVHLHSLFWLQDVETINLPEVVHATMPQQDATMEGYVRGSQLDHSGLSKWPLCETDSVYDAAQNMLRLRHTAADHRLGLRAFFPAIMAAVPGTC
jgi:hypothetical protein